MLSDDQLIAKKSLARAINQVKADLKNANSTEQIQDLAETLSELSFRARTIAGPRTVTPRDDRGAHRR